MRSIDNKFYKSAVWEKCRKAYIQKVGGLCERCLKKGLIVPGKIVHHKEHLTEENYKNPEVSLNFENLELLCQECHNKEHFEISYKSRYSFNEDGSIKIE